MNKKEADAKTEKELEKPILGYMPKKLWFEIRLLNLMKFLGRLGEFKEEPDLELIGKINNEIDEVLYLIHSMKKKK